MCLLSPAPCRKSQPIVPDLQSRKMMGGGKASQVRHRVAVGRKGEVLAVRRDADRGDSMDAADQVVRMDRLAEAQARIAN